MSEGPGAGNIIAGIFVILFGLCITLVGGGCTLLLLSEIQSLVSGGGGLLLVISLVTLGGGLALLWLGFRLVTGRIPKP